MDNSTLDIDSLSISDPTATSFHLTQRSTIRSNSAYHPTLDAFNASLSLKGSEPYADITIPSIDAEAVASSVVDQVVQIKDMKRFTEYNVALLNSESVTMEIVGRTGLHEMKFPETTVEYRKIVTIKGTFPGILPDFSTSLLSPSTTTVRLTSSARLQQTCRLRHPLLYHQAGPRSRRDKYGGPSLHSKSHRHDHRNGTSPLSPPCLTPFH